MLVNKAYKFRIYPTKEQEILIAKTIGCSRFVFNRFLEQWNDTYKKTGKGLTYNSCSAELTKLKKELVWLKEVDSIALQSSLKNLADSYTRFFKKQNKAPRFKSKIIKYNPTLLKKQIITLRLQTAKSNCPNSGMFALPKVVKYKVVSLMLLLDEIQVANILYPF